MTGIWLLYSTFASREEAVSAAEKLLEERLIACASLWPGAVSLYRWEGQARQEEEYLMLAKTAQEKIPQAKARLAELHAYDVPCILAWPAEADHAPYADWVRGEVLP